MVNYNGNYTGYSVDGFDVFLWVLLTVGTIGFPVVVFTICCLKQRLRTQKLEHQLLYADPSKKKNLERGFLGPYAESRENIDQRTDSKMPEIVIQPYNLGVNNKVRFKDDQEPNQLPTMQMNNNDLPVVDNVDSQQADLRGLKNAVNYFAPSVKKQSFSNPSDFSGTQQSNIDRYVQNPMQQQNFNQEPNAIYSSASQLNGSDRLVYSQASSYPQPGIQATMSQTSNLVPENIYSQVIAPQNRKNQNPSNEIYSNSQQEYYDQDDQPVYMNTPYNYEDNGANMQRYEGDYDQQYEQQESIRRDKDWNDSSV